GRAAWRSGAVHSMPWAVFAKVSVEPTQLMVLKTLICVSGCNEPCRRVIGYMTRQPRSYTRFHWPEVRLAFFLSDAGTRAVVRPLWRGSWGSAPALRRSGDTQRRFCPQHFFVSSAWQSFTPIP